MSRQQERTYGVGSVYQRKSDGRWVAKLGNDGKPITRYAATEKEAKTILVALQRECGQNGTLATPGNRTVNDLLDLWLQTAQPNLKPRTFHDYQARCKRHLRPVLGHVKLSKLSPERVQAFYTKLLSCGIEREALYSHAMLHRACKMAVLWGWLAQNPCDRVIRPKHQAERKEMWSIEELHRFLEGTRDQWLHPLWVVAASTGCRLSELQGLRWQDVDLAASTLRVSRSLHRIEGQWVESTPKTRAGNRTMVLPAAAVAALKGQRAQQAEWRLKAGPQWQDTALVFTGEHGQPLAQSTVQKAMHREIERLDLPPLTPHGLRHMAASLLLSKGLPVPAVSARLGHASPNITMSIYAHAMKQQDQQAAALMQEVMNSRA
ncbi:MAG TPA: site-specific integrase [Chloroflexota bacterium]|nr:site-specific integrase [Chloroflexota bacterium]